MQLTRTTCALLQFSMLAKSFLFYVWPIQINGDVESSGKYIEVNLRNFIFSTLLILNFFS